MKKLAIRSKIEEAEQQLTIAEEEFATSIRALRGVPRAEKTVPTEIIESALEKLRVSKAKVSELKKLLEEELDRERDG